MAKSKKQNHKHKKSALEHLDKRRQYFVVDASAVLNGVFTEIPMLTKRLSVSGPIFLITTTLLTEIDNKIHSNLESSKRERANSFLSLLRGTMQSGKLSDGQRLAGSNGKILLIKEDMSEFDREELSWMPTGPDRQLLCLAIHMAAVGYRSIILTADSLMQVIAVEEDLSYIYVGPTGELKFPKTYTGSIALEEKTSSSDQEVIYS